MRDITNFNAMSDNSTVTITAVSEPNPAGAVNHYRVAGINMGSNNEYQRHLASYGRSDSQFAVETEEQHFFFQSGNPATNGYNGITMEVLLAMGIDRLYSLQNGQFPSYFNEVALYHMGKALDALHDRTDSLQSPDLKAQAAAAIGTHFAIQSDPSLSEYIPILTVDNSDKFVDPKIVYGEDLHINGAAASTGPLKFGTPMDMLAMTRFEPLVEAGIQDHADVLGEISLSAIYMSLPNTTVNNHTTITSGPAPVIKFELTPGEVKFVPSKEECGTYTLKGSIALWIPKDVKSVNDNEIQPLWGEVAKTISGISVWCHLDGTYNAQTGAFRLGVGGTTIHRMIHGDVDIAILPQEDPVVAEARRNAIAIIELAQWVGFDPAVKRIPPKAKPLTADQFVEIPATWAGAAMPVAGPGGTSI